MTKTMKRLNKTTRRGRALRTGSGWRLLQKDRLFSATLLTTINKGGQRLAIFSVPKHKREAD